MRGTVQMRTKCDAVVCHFAQFTQAEDLVASRIRKDCSGPGHEFVQTAHIADEFVTWAEIQMVGIGQKNLNAERFQVCLGLRLYSRRCAHRHERRSVNHSVWRSPQ